jgi:Tsi6
MTRLELFQEALLATKSLQAKYAHSKPIQSVVDQLSYLVDLQSRLSTDRSKLTTINIGVIAAREIEDIDMGLAEKLHEVAAVVRTMADAK